MAHYFIRLKNLVSYPSDGPELRGNVCMPSVYFFVSDSKIQGKVKNSWIQNVDVQVISKQMIKHVILSNHVIFIYNKKYSQE